MELVADVLNNLLHRAATDFAFLNLAGTPVNDCVPLRFRVSIHGVIAARDELPGQICPVLFRQGQHFNHFFSRNAHAAKTSALTGVRASLNCL